MLQHKKEQYRSTLHHATVDETYELLNYFERTLNWTKNTLVLFICSPYVFWTWAQWSDLLLLCCQTLWFMRLFVATAASADINAAANSLIIPHNMLTATRIRSNVLITYAWLLLRSQSGRARGMLCGFRLLSASPHITMGNGSPEGDHKWRRRRTTNGPLRLSSPASKRVRIKLYYYLPQNKNNKWTAQFKAAKRSAQVKRPFVRAQACD